MTSKHSLLLFSIFIVAFMFRAAIVYHNGYPPSTDVGLHTNIIDLIIDQETLPLWNPHHMGGEPLSNSPGYHLFTSTIVFFTGLPSLAVQPLIAAFFSSFAVFPMFLISKKIWKSKGAGLISAFLLAVSSFSLEMLGWGGYPNVISLSLIAVIFYLFLRNMTYRNRSHSFAAALIFSALILTHLFSLSVFLPILILYCLLLLMLKALGLKKISFLNVFRFISVSVALGVLMASPWIIRSAGFYVDMLSEGVFFGGIEENRNLILLNRNVDVRFLLLVGAIIPTVLMFKASRRRYIDGESLLLIVWFTVPLALTQSNIAGIVVDYARFAYFADFAGILILSAVITYVFYTISSRFKGGEDSRSDRRVLSRERLSQSSTKVGMLVFLLTIYWVSPLMSTPMEALTRVRYYKTVDEAEAQVIEWIRGRTLNDVTLVSDHLLGWWLSGSAKRSTLSAVSPEFLLYSHEIEVAKSALILLDTDYYIDNGLIQIREDGGYLSRHNPIFIIDRDAHLPYSVCHFNDEEITVFTQEGEASKAIDLAELHPDDAKLTVSAENRVDLSITRESSLLRVNKTVTVHRGVRFAELSYTIHSLDSDVTIDWVRFILHIKRGDITLCEEMMSLFDYSSMVVGQIIFKGSQPRVKVYTEENPSSVEFLYHMNDSTTVTIGFLVGLWDVENLQWEEIHKVVESVPEEPMKYEFDLKLVASSYVEILQSYDIDYVVCRDQQIYEKFSEDPKFILVYHNVEVAIFKFVK